ncbi:hypothetical protein AC1031_014067 [Aphanomyces cochlioides]|nr:hypothetical protein AC1031_014067 [Aphanomyces cochlioides]
MKTTSVLVAASCIASASAGIIGDTLCQGKFQTYLYGSMASSAYLSCLEKTGVSPATTSPSDADLQNVLAEPVCTKWWDGVVSDVKGISPPCDITGPDGTTFNTTSFPWTIKTLFQFVKQNAANITTTVVPLLAIRLLLLAPTSGGAITAVPASALPAVPAVTATVAPAVTPKSDAFTVGVATTAIVVMTMMA